MAKNSRNRKGSKFESDAEKSRNDKFTSEKSNGRRKKGKGSSGDRKPWDTSKNARGYSARCSLNDLSWYSQNPELLDAGSRFPFPYRPTMCLDLGDTWLPDNWVDHEFDDYENTSVPGLHAVPGFMSIEYAYGIGYSEDVTSPASVAAKELIASVRSQFSGNLAVEAPDLFMYLMANDQIHAYIAWLKRMYKTINAFSSQNYFFPEGALEAQWPQDIIQGFMPDGFVTYLRAHKTQFWGNINILVHMANKFNVPGRFDIFNRHRWMNENIYSDLNAVRGQMYVFAPRGFYQVDDAHENGTALVWHGLVSEFAPLGTPDEWFNHLFEFGAQLIGALSDWEDAYTINGYILKAFPANEYYMCSLLGESDVISPAFEEEVLNQIHNATIVRDYNFPDITQEPNTNAVLFTPKGRLITSNALVDCEGDIPTGAEITLSTRLTAVRMDNLAVGKISMGTEVVTGISVTVPEYFFDPYTSQKRKWRSFQIEDQAYFNFSKWFNGVDFSEAAASEVVHNALLRMQIGMYLSCWRKAPRLFIRTFIATRELTTDYVWNETDYGKEINKLLVCGELDNATSVSAADIDNLHRICVYSEFNCFNRS